MAKKNNHFSKSLTVQQQNVFSALIQQLLEGPIRNDVENDSDDIDDNGNIDKNINV